MSIDLDRGLWVCFGCGEKGGLVALAHRLDQEVDEAVLLQRAHDAASAAPYYAERPDFTEKARLLEDRLWEAKPGHVGHYLKTRGIRPEAVQHFGLGWDGARIAMPYWDGQRAIGIKYRSYDGSKTSEPGSQRYIYNVNEVRTKPVVVLCEGESDTHRLWTAVDRSQGLWHNAAVGGIPGVGRGQPSRPTWELWLLELMWAKRVYVAFDADEAGDNGALVPMALLGSKAVRARPTKGKDVCEHFANGGSLEGLGLDEEDLRLLMA